MAHPKYLRDKARQLRIEKRMSLLEIADRLALPKTTVWYWIKDLPDPAITHRETEGRRRSRLAAARSNKRRAYVARADAYDLGWDEYPAFIQEPTFRDFVCMYIGEGYKRSRNNLSVANSDPLVIKLADHWIRRFARNPVTYAFQYHDDQDPEKVRSYWADCLGTEPEKITYQRKSNSGKLSGRVWRSEHGVLSVRASDTMLRARLQAWMDRLQAGWLDSLDPGV
jgi:hypothetical protein